jgi:hypothetical protein
MGFRDSSGFFYVRATSVLPIAGVCYVKLTITITPYKKDLVLESYSTTISFPTFQKNIHTRFSCFFISGLTNDAYSVTAVTGTDTTYKQVKENPGKLSFGMTALLTGGYRFSQYFSLHFSLGPGIAISNKLSPRLMAGGGCGFGNRNIFVVDGGFAGWLCRPA